MWSLMIRSPKSEVREHRLKEGLNILGRHSDIEVFISDHAASRRHAQIEVQPENEFLTLTDLGSTNGTFLNGQQVKKPEKIGHNDKIRIGRHLITVVSMKERNKDTAVREQRRSVVTGELLLQSVDSYAVLLHDIGYQLINIPDLDEAFSTISETVKKMIAAEDCRILMVDQAGELLEEGIPQAIYDDVLTNNSATIFSLDQTGETETKIPDRSVMLVPVELEDQVAAVIWAWKDSLPYGFSQESDLQLVIAVSHQVALSVQRNRFETELLHNAYFDQLTGLSNRAYFSDRINQALSWTKRHEDYLFATLFMDIDNFKVVNDSLGHSVGDQVLKAFADRLEKNLREQDTVSRTNAIARFGGDEFSVLLDDIPNEREAFLVANRLKEVLSAPFNIDGEDIFVSTSIGITLNNLEYASAEEMIRDTEIAMYRAKELGRSQVVMYDSVMHNTLVERLSLETRLRKGMQNDEFHLYYQPIVSIQDEKVVGLEALLRWHTPDQGVLTPGNFFSAMHTSGLINLLDEWVLDYAAKDAARFQKIFPMDPPIYISVNISANMVSNPNLVKLIDKILKKNKISTGSLRLEITEKADLGDSKLTQAMFHALRDRGIRLSLDDFGTGYSTLSYLLTFPADSLKIDQSFVQQLEAHNESYKIIETLRALTEHLDIKLVAEGIETKEQLAFLKELSCDFGQGYLFDKARSFDEIVKYIRENLGKD